MDRVNTDAEENIQGYDEVGTALNYRAFWMCELMFSIISELANLPADHQRRHGTCASAMCNSG